MESEARTDVQNVAINPINYIQVISYCDIIQMRVVERIIILVLIFFFSISCRNANGTLEYVEPGFEKESIVNVKVMNNHFMFNIGSIKVVDTLIIYSGATDVSDKAFHIFSNNTGKYLTNFGNIGRAKGELTQLSAGFSIDKERRIMYVFDTNQGKTITYSLDKVLSGNPDYAKEIHLPDIVTNVSSTRFFYLKNSFLVGYPYCGRFLVCSETDSITSNDFYPTLDEPEPYKIVEHRYFFQWGCMSVKPDGDMFVHATRGGCIMEIWKYDGNTISPYIIKGFFKPNYLSYNRDMNYPSVRINSDDPYGISALACSNQYIYAIYDNIPNSWSNKIAIFDWNGCPQKLYVTNHKFMSIDVDDNNDIYALAIDDDGNIELVSISWE